MDPQNLHKDDGNIRDLSAVPMEKQEAETGGSLKELRAGSLVLTVAMKKRDCHTKQKLRDLKGPLTPTMPTPTKALKDLKTKQKTQNKIPDWH